MEKENNFYYDYEYDRIVNENVIKSQFNWFKKQNWFNKSYEQFKNENFELIVEE